MLLDQARLDFAYEQILQDAAKVRGACSVLIFVAPNCDAMCACRIISYMLRADAVSYKIKPVSGYGDIAAANEDLIKGNADLRSVVMINCGAICNVSDLLSHLLPEGYIYIVDSNRPVHLANVYPRRDRVVVFVDEANGDVDNIPSDGDGLDGNDETSDESGEDSDEMARASVPGDGESIGSCLEKEPKPEEEEGEEEEEELASNESDEEGTDDEGSDGDDPDASMQQLQGPVEKENRSPNTSESSAPKGSRPGPGEKTFPSVEQRTGRGRKRKREEKTPSHAAREAAAMRRQRIRQYYSGATHCSSSAVQLFAMAMQLNKDTNDLLWLAIVGLTDHYIHQRIDQDVYQLVVVQLQQHVVAKNSKVSRETSSADGETLVPVSEIGRITSDMEYRFMLYRHWSLYESMYFSNFIASKLNVWNSNGRHRLEEFLAKMGFSLEQCKQKYPFMSSQLRKRLRDQIEKYADDYGLQDIFYGSYQRYCGFKNPLSAADMVYCITALTEHREADANASQGSGADIDPGDDDPDDWIDSFNIAYDALSGKRLSLLKSGLSLSMSLQRAVVQQAVSMMEKRSLTLFKHFRYAFIRSSETDEKLFTQPMALRKLAAFLVDVHRENGRWAGEKARPLVIMAERKASYLVVGTTCPQKAGTVTKNRFGACFQLAAQQIQARAKHDGFESSAMEINKDDVHDFIQALHDTLSA